jgi:hypothetical protein
MSPIIFPTESVSGKLRGNVSKIINHVGGMPANETQVIGVPDALNDLLRKMCDNPQVVADVRM